MFEHAWFKISDIVLLASRPCWCYSTKHLQTNKEKSFFNGIYKYQKRLIDLHSPFEIVKQVTSISIELGVEVEVTISDV